MTNIQRVTCMMTRVTPVPGVPDFLEPFGQVDDMEKAFCFHPDAMEDDELAAFPDFGR